MALCLCSEQLPRAKDISIQCEDICKINMRIEPVNSKMGARVSGVKLDEDLDERLFLKLRREPYIYAVVVSEEKLIDDAQKIAFLLWWAQWIRPKV